MTWEEWMRQQAPLMGLRVTSGYRTPEQEAALGGPASSFHSTGTPDAPGAIDVGGPAASLKKLFDDIRTMFAGRINELYLNLPAGGSEDIKNNAPLGHNPEAGRAQHLHVALSAGAVPTGPAPGPAPASATIEPGGAADCVRSFCHPTAASLLGGGAERCICWSDIWIYGAAVFAIVGGAWLTFKGAGK